MSLHFICASFDENGSDGNPPYETSVKSSMCNRLSDHSESSYEGDLIQIETFSSSGT